MKNTLLVLLLVCLLFLSVVTNPDEGDCQSDVREAVKTELGLDGLVFDSVAYALSKRLISTDDYIVFCVIKFKGVKVGYGLFGKTILNINLLKSII